jgi:hypothetical protein
MLAGCDTVQPSSEGTLVVEAYLESGRALPLVRVSRTWNVASRSVAGNGSVPGAEVSLVIDGVVVRYEDDPDSIGTYRPEPAHAERTVPPLAAFSMTVRSDGDEAVAVGFVPPAISLKNVRITVPDRAIEAVFLDTLNIGIDSLELSLDARQGYIYPVQVDLSWDVLPSEDPALDYWIQTRLEPRTPFSSSIIDFFLLPRQILPEAATERMGEGERIWSGVYAVPVETAETPVPVHGLQVFVLRGDRAFAVFETSRDSPERREPETNLTGGIGFVGGIAFDSLSLMVPPATPDARASGDPRTSRTAERAVQFR